MQRFVVVRSAVISIPLEHSGVVKILNDLEDTVLKEFRYFPLFYLFIYVLT
jgi:hypothetical protein